MFITRKFLLYRSVYFIISLFIFEFSSAAGQNSAVTPLTFPVIHHENNSFPAIKPDTINQFKNTRFDVTISLGNGNDYRVEQNIFVKVEVKNVGNTVDSLRLLYEDDVYSMLSVFTDAGNKIQFKGFPGDRYFESDEPYFKFIPGETRTFLLNVFYSYGLIAENALSFSNHFYLPEGNYSVIYNYYDPKNDLSFNSNLLKFKVSPPNVIDSIELARLREIYKIPVGSGEDAIKKINAYKQFCMIYPNSIYFEEAFFYNVIFCVNIRYFNLQMIDEVNQFIDKYPKSGYISSVIWGGMDASFTLIGKTAAKKFLDSIVERNPLLREIVGEIEKSNYYTGQIK